MGFSATATRPTGMNVASIGLPGGGTAAVFAPPSASTDSYAGLDRFAAIDAQLTRLSTELKRLAGAGIRRRYSLPRPMPAPPTPQRAGGVRQFADPESFVLKGKYWRLVAPKGGIDITDRQALNDRARRSTISFLTTYEHESNFAIEKVSTRLVKSSSDAALLKVDPGAYAMSSVSVRFVDGRRSVIPVVTNRDGATYVDPKIHF